MNELTTVERDRLSSLEKTVEKGKRAFIEVGNALKEIRDSKLYKATHGTFALYVEDRFGFTAQHAGRICKAAELAPILEPIGSTVTESQAREIAKASPENRVAIVERAIVNAQSQGKPMSAAVIKAARKEVVGEVVPDDPPEEFDDADDEYEDVDMSDDETISIEPEPSSKLGLIRSLLLPLEAHELRLVIEWATDLKASRDEVVS